MPYFSTTNISPRRASLLAAFLCVLIASLVAAGCSRSESVTVQVDIGKSIDVSNKARSPGTIARAAVSGFTLAAGMDDVLRKTIDTDEFRRLSISRRFAQQDDPRHTKLLNALAEMCSCSVRGAPAAIRVTVAGSDTKEATAIANLIGRTFGETAMVDAAADLATRREIEHQSLTRLLTQASDLESAIRRLDPAADPDKNSDSAASDESDQQAKQLARREVLTRELRRAQSEKAQATTISHMFEDLVATVVACPAWIVPPNACNDAGWTTLDRLDSSVAVLAVINPTNGRDWLAGSLSQTDKTLSAAAGHSVVSTTTWRIAFDQQASVSTVSLPSSADTAATSDLARRVRATPLGDGTVISLGLTGNISATDQRAILGALTTCIMAKKRADINIEAVNKREPIDRRITILSTELREHERAFAELAGRSSATSENISSLYERSREGQEIERVQDELTALRKQRDAIDFESQAIFDDVLLIRNVERTE